ncbi:MAG: M24 family metallopeptidase [Patescibacteria group bacterium]
MIDIKTDKEIALMKKGGQILSLVLHQVAKSVKPGISTYDLDKMAYQMIKQRKAKPSFLGHEGYPASLCVSINEELVHGLPHKDRIIKSGDIVSVDLGVKYKGLYTDMALTVAVGQISPEA